MDDLRTELPPELLALGRFTHNLLRRIVRFFFHLFLMARPLGQTLHHGFNQLHIFQRHEGSGYGVQKIRPAGRAIELTRQQSAKFVEGHQRAGYRILCVLAWPQSHGADLRRTHRRGRLDALGSQPVAHLTEELAKTDPEQTGGGRDQRRSRLLVRRILRQAGLQRPYKSVWLQGVELRLNRVPSQQTADQCI